MTDGEVRERAAEWVGWLCSSCSGGQLVIRTHANGATKSDADLAEAVRLKLMERTKNDPRFPWHNLLAQQLLWKGPIGFCRAVLEVVDD